MAENIIFTEKKRSHLVSYEVQNLVRAIVEGMANLKPIDSSLDSKNAIAPMKDFGESHSNNPVSVDDIKNLLKKEDLEFVTSSATTKSALNLLNSLEFAASHELITIKGITNVKRRVLRRDFENTATLSPADNIAPGCTPVTISGIFKKIASRFTSKG